MVAVDDDELLLLLEASCERQGSGVWHDPRDKRGRETRGGSDALCEYGQNWRGEGCSGKLTLSVERTSP
jgi:hypothetical protein